MINKINNIYKENSIETNWAILSNLTNELNFESLERNNIDEKHINLYINSLLKLNNHFNEDSRLAFFYLIKSKPLKSFKIATMQELKTIFTIFSKALILCINNKKMESKNEIFLLLNIISEKLQNQCD